MIDNIIGTQIGIYNVLYECEHKANDGHKMYHVQCIKCGYETDMQKSDIKRTRYCKHIGVNNEYINYNMNWKNKRISSIFAGMKDRCYNINCKDYCRYGGKGIKICDEWINHPNLFEEWAIENGYNDKLTIDRIDSHKDYCPENCRWITLEDNAKYKSTTSLINVDGEVHSGRDWSKILGLGINRVNNYIRKYGIENTVEFIKRYRNNPNLCKSNNRNLYDMYMGH